MVYVFPTRLCASPVLQKRDTMLLFICYVLLITLCLFAHSEMFSLMRLGSRLLAASRIRSLDDFPYLSNTLRRVLDASPRQNLYDLDLRDCLWE